MRDQINRALGELVADGTLAALYQQFGLNSIGSYPGAHTHPGAAADSHPAPAPLRGWHGSGAAI